MTSCDAARSQKPSEKVSFACDKLYEIVGAVVDQAVLSRLCQRAPGKGRLPDGLVCLRAE